jgi:hypothetical protein
MDGDGHLFTYFLRRLRDRYGGLVLPGDLRVFCHGASSGWFSTRQQCSTSALSPGVERNNEEAGLEWARGGAHVREEFHFGQRGLLWVCAQWQLLGRRRAPRARGRHRGVFLFT